MHRQWPWQRSAGRRCGGGYEPELAIRCRRSVSRGDTVFDCDREFRTGCCRKRLHRPASCWREGSGEEQKRLGIRGNPGPSSFGSCGVDESAVDHSPARRTTIADRWVVRGDTPRPLFWRRMLCLGKLPQRAALISGGAVRRRPFPSRLSRLSAIVQQIAPKTASG